MANRPAPTNIQQDLDVALRSAVERGALRIPPYPAVAMKIQTLVSRREYGLGDLAKIVSSDATLAADVLRCANSALYRRGEPVNSLGQAIGRVGAQEVARLALSSGLSAQAQAPGPLVALKRTLWIEGVACAVLCQVLARRRGLQAEQAFVLGLLHDFGKVVVATALEEQLEGRRVAPRPLEEWAALVERHHVAAGASVAQRWDLPALLQEVIRLHHVPAGAGCSEPALIDLVQASDQVVALLSLRPQVEAADLAETPGVAPDERELVVQVIEKIPSFAASFEAPAPPASASTSAVAPPLTTLAPGQRTATFGVQTVLDKRARSYVAVAVAVNGIVLLGAEPLPERQLVELALQCQPRPFRVWATVQSCRTEGSQQRVEAQLFGVGGEARALWGQLYASAGRG
jgi:HD-like signal output (HDOD) protein